MAVHSSWSGSSIKEWTVPVPSSAGAVGGAERLLLVVPSRASHHRYGDSVIKEGVRTKMEQHNMSMRRP